MKGDMAVLLEIEKLTGPIPRLSSVSGDTFGVKLENDRVIQLGLYNKGLSTLPESIGILTSLIYLNVRENNILTLPESIGNLKSLKSLDLRRNKISTLPESIGQLSSLNILFVDNNQLSTLPESIENLKSLRSLQLNYNQLKALPESIGQLFSLKELSLNSNRLSTLPESIGNLKSLETLWLRDNQLSTLPESALNYKFLKVINGLEENSNPLGNSAFINKCRSKALKLRGIDKQVVLSLAERCKDRLNLWGERNVYLSPNVRNWINKYEGYLYAGTVSLLGVVFFIGFETLFSYLDPNLAALLFFIALGINVLVGAAIISTLSGYLKRFLERTKNMVPAIQRRILNLFDVFVVFYLVWSVRAAVRTLLDVELISAVDFVFEYTLSPSILGFLAIFGYDIGISFLENLDLFLGHFFFKLFGLSIVFWALYKNGLAHLKKTAFDEEKHKNIRSFLVLGIIGVVVLALMHYSTLAPLLGVGFNLGAFVACVIFVWEQNLSHPRAFYLFMSTIGCGIILVWLLWIWSPLLSFGVGVIFVALFFYERYAIEMTDRYIRHDVEKTQVKALKQLQLRNHVLLPSVTDINNEVGFVIERNKVIQIKFGGIEFSTLPKSIGSLKSLTSLLIVGTKISKLPKSIGNLSSLNELNLYHNQLKTLPKSIGDLSSLKELILDNNKLQTLPESIGDLKSLRSLKLRNNDLKVLPESIKKLEKRGVIIYK